jgi:hypothetical protein
MKPMLPTLSDFINLISPNIGRENDARGWMLLEHLKLFAKSSFAAKLQSDLNFVSRGME